MTTKQRAGQIGGRSTSAAKVAAVRANGAKGGRPRKDGTPRATEQLPAPATPAGVPPLWQRLEAFLRAHGPTTLRSLRCVAVDRAERERVRQELTRRPHLFRETPALTVGADIWELYGAGNGVMIPSTRST